MSETRFPTLTAEQMTDEQRAVVDAIESGPRGPGLRAFAQACLFARKGDGADPLKSIKLKTRQCRFLVSAG
jgi:hypothetical protein